MALPADQATAFWHRAQELGGPARTAEILTERLGKQVGPKDVTRFGRAKNPPKAWRDAVGLEAAEPEPIADDQPAAAAGERASEQAPKPPSEASVLPPAAELRDVARKRLTEIHVFAGGAIATAVDPDGFQNDRGPGGGVAKLWTDKAPDVAQAWVAWAEEGNKFAQSVVRLMSTGGAGGELVMGYVMLLGGTAYLLGQIPDNDATRFVYGRYAKYRPVDHQPRDAADGGDAAAGAGGEGSDNGGVPVDAGSLDRLAGAGVPPVG